MSERGGGDAGAVVGGWVGNPDPAGVGEDLGFHGPGAAHAPVGGDHFLDHGLLDAIGGGEAIEVLREEKFEAILRLAGENHAVGEKTVNDGILGRATLAFGSYGAAGKTSVKPA